MNIGSLIPDDAVRTRGAFHQGYNIFCDPAKNCLVKSFSGTIQIVYAVALSFMNIFRYMGIALWNVARSVCKASFEDLYQAVRDFCKSGKSLLFTLITAVLVIIGVAIPCIYHCIPPLKALNRREGSPMPVSENNRVPQGEKNHVPQGEKNHVPQIEKNRVPQIEKNRVPQGEDNSVSVTRENPSNRLVFHVSQVSPLNSPERDSFVIVTEITESTPEASRGESLQVLELSPVSPASTALNLSPLTESPEETSPPRIESVEPIPFSTESPEGASSSRIESVEPIPFSLEEESKEPIEALLGRAMQHPLLQDFNEENWVNLRIIYDSSEKGKYLLHYCPGIETLAEAPIESLSEAPWTDRELAAFEVFRLQDLEKAEKI